MPAGHAARTIPEAMKPLAALLLVLVVCPVLAQPGPGWQKGQPNRQRPAHHEYMRPMPPAERRMDWEQRQRLRDQVRNGEMSRDEARQRWREERDRRGMEQGRNPEERQRMRRDVRDAIRDLERR
jgi:hypothetical protein